MALRCLLLAGPRQGRLYHLRYPDQMLERVRHDRGRSPSPLKRPLLQLRLGAGQSRLSDLSPNLDHSCNYGISVLQVRRVGIQLSSD